MTLAQTQGRINDNSTFRHPGWEKLLAAVGTYGTRDLEAYKQLGKINVQQQGDLLLFNYTQECQFERTWNDVERICRGIVIDATTGEIVIRPFPKFFNLGERPETMLDALPQTGFEATEKLDGSLILVAKHRDELVVITRGSFTSDQAIWARNYIEQNYPKLKNLRPRRTLMFEAIYPDNRIVVNYGQEEKLVLIGATYRENFDFDHDSLMALGYVYDLPVVESVPYNSLQDMVSDAQKLTGIEGWVLRFDGGFRVKVKTDEYRTLHKLVSNLSPGAIRDALVLGDIDTLLKGLPDEYMQEAKQLADDMDMAVSNAYFRISGIYAGILTKLNLKIANSEETMRCEVTREERKAFAKEASQYGTYTPYLFGLLDGHDIMPKLYKALDLTQFSASRKLERKLGRSGDDE